MTKIHKPLIYAHRGASKDAPENTMAAFELAHQMGADGFELDVQITKDGKLVVLHDDKIDRTSNGTGVIEQLHYDDLKKLDFGSWKDSKFAGEHIPLLDEVCKYAKDNNLLLNIEIKPMMDSSETEQKVIELCRQYDLFDQVVTSSFSHYTMRSIKKRCRNIETAILYQSGLLKAARYAKFTAKADGIHPHKYAVIPECVKNAALHGIKIRPWTVDNVKLFKKLAANKYITGVITNTPDVLRKALDEMNK